MQNELSCVMVVALRPTMFVGNGFSRCLSGGELPSFSIGEAAREELLHFLAGRRPAGKTARHVSAEKMLLSAAPPIVPSPAFDDIDREFQAKLISTYKRRQQGAQNGGVDS